MEARVSNSLDAKDVRIFCEIAFRGLDYDSFTDRGEGSVS
jgi:hypothetical protein